MLYYNIYKKGGDTLLEKLSLSQLILGFFISLALLILLLVFFVEYMRFLGSEFAIVKDTTFLKVLLNKKEKMKYKTVLDIEYYEKKPEFFADIKILNTKQKFDLLYFNSGGIFLITCFPYKDKVFVLGNVHIYVIYSQS